MSPNEFARPIRIDTLGDGARAISIAAEEAERAALAKRFGLVSIDRLEADAALVLQGRTISAEGRLRGGVVQSCVATGDPLPVTINTEFSLRFVPEDEAPTGEELELEAGDLDVMTYDGSAIDLGEAVAETLLLSLDPFPRSAHADVVLKEAGVVGEGEVVGEASPLAAALKGLKDKLSK
jgi:uncharacterized metal-binding protein YceD (DUF177 family)